MQINVNCGGCGCGCKGTSQNPFLDELGQPIINDGPIPSDQLPEENVDNWKCDSTHQLVGEVIDFINNAATAALVGTLGAPVVAALLALATLITAGTVWIVGFLALLAGVVTVNPLDWVRDWLSEKRSELICVIYGAASPSLAYAGALAYLSDHKADVNGSVAGFWVEAVLKLVFSGVDWNALFNVGSVEISSQNTGSVCPCEGVVIFDVLGDGEWYLVPAIEGEIFIQGNATYQVTNYIWNFVATEGNQHCQSYPDFTEFLAAGRTWIGGTSPVSTTSEHAGYVMERVGGSTAVQTFDISGSGIIGVDEEDFPLDDVWTERNADSDMDLTTFRDALDIIFAGLDIVHFDDQTYNNANQHRMTVRGIGEDPKTMQFRLYAVIKATALNL